MHWFRRIENLNLDLADDIVIFSNTKSGLQKKLDKLHEYCKEWCLEINLSKSQVLIFNKPGKHLKDNFTFNNNTIECVNDYKYLGMKFTSSGIFKQGKEDIHRKSVKAVHIQIAKILLIIQSKYLYISSFVRPYN